MRRDHPSAAPRRLSGFTLIELLVVLTIAALLATLALPVLLRQDDRTASTAAVAQVRAALRIARVTAITESRTVSFSGGAESGYRIDGRLWPISTAGRHIRVDVAGKPEIIFFPTGASSGGRIVVRGQATRRDIAVEALTGRAVVDP